MDAVVGLADLQVREHHDPLGVDGAVCDPVLLGQRGGSVDDKLVWSDSTGLLDWRGISHESLNSQ